MTRTMRFKVPAVILTVALLLSLCSVGIPASADDSALPDSDYTYDVSETPNVKITESGVYTVTGTCSDGSVTVKKGVTGVTLILKDLDLTAAATAPLACNKETEATIYIVGTVTLTDAEDAALEDVSDDYEGAALKIKANASVALAGSGALNLIGSSKNGLKLGDEAALSVADGLTLNITAANDGVNANSDLTLAGGTITVSAGDDAIHSDAALTVDGANITITKSYEGLEGSSVYLNSGSAYITASDDGINAASDENGTVEIVINGGTWYVNAGGDGLDAGGESNRGNGSITINGGETVVFGAANDGNGALDSESGVTYNGGTLLAVGMSGMAEAPGGGKVLVFGSAMGGGMMGRPGEMNGMNGQPGFGGMGPMSFSQPTGFGSAMGGSQQFDGMNGRQSQAPDMSGSANTQPGTQTRNGMNQTQTASSLSINAGSVIEIRDENGNTIYAATAVKSANSVVFAGDSVVSGGTYTLYVDGSAVATAAAGQGATGGMQMDQQPGMDQNQQPQQGQAPDKGGMMGQPAPQMGGQPGGFGGQQPGNFGGGFDRQPMGGDPFGGAPMGGMMQDGFGGRQQPGGFGGFMGR